MIVVTRVNTENGTVSLEDQTFVHHPKKVSIHNIQNSHFIFSIIKLTEGRREIVEKLIVTYPVKNSFVTRISITVWTMTSNSVVFEPVRLHSHYYNAFLGINFRNTSSKDRHSKLPIPLTPFK
jgi:hypothetical protein